MLLPAWIARKVADVGVHRHQRVEHLQLGHDAVQRRLEAVFLLQGLVLKGRGERIRHFAPLVFPRIEFVGVLHVH